MNLFKINSINELIWMLPFTYVALLSFALLRSEPEFPNPDPQHNRFIKDSNGIIRAIPVPFSGVASGKYWAYDFLQKTHAPESLVKIAGPNDRPKYIVALIYWFYPLLVEDESRWDFPDDLESVLANDRGYVHFDGRFSRFGLNVVAFMPEITTQDDVISGMIRCLNDIVDQPEIGQEFITDYQRRKRNVTDELQLETIFKRPKVLNLVSRPDDWSNLWGWSGDDLELGFLDAAEDLTAMGRGSEAERFLAMNPDLIFLAVGDAPRFMRDPRWLGLKAVREKKVYGMIYRFNPYGFDSDSVPLILRWKAELAYPERLKPILRELARDHYEKNYGYRLKDDEIDWFLRMDENLSSEGYSRFVRINPKPVENQKQ
ncbi:MAG: ABC transporter substrate-binding protein [Deltaproteobacteria bacterium]|jgi:hypothetical protein|nr:ABC transporter substrate-binding protein [Deltaproteobacteria bacterium]